MRFNDIRNWLSADRFSGRNTTRNDRYEPMDNGDKIVVLLGLFIFLGFMGWAVLI